MIVATRGHLGALKASGLGMCSERALRFVRRAAWLFVGALIGYVTWGQDSQPASLVALLTLPVLAGAMGSRCEAWALMLGYFAAGARGLPDGAVVFFGDEAPAWWGLAMWATVSLLLSAPFALLWRKDVARRGAGFGAATLLCLAPPLGIVGWLNPLTAAGLLFPAWGWAGLALTLLTFVSLASRRTLAIVACACTAAIANHGASPAVAPKAWLGFDTDFARLSSAGADHASQLLAAMRRIEWLEGVVADMPADATLVLPETLLGRYDGVAQAMLAQSDAALRAKRSRVLVGGELPQPNGQYKNAMVVLGAQQDDGRAAVQGLPVPVSMWKPWADDGAQADLLARDSVIAVGPWRAGVSVCYEQLLAYSLLLLMAKSPDVIVASSNVWWAKSTSIPNIQVQSVQAFARLFHVPVVSARNL